MLREELILALVEDTFWEEDDEEMRREKRRKLMRRVAIGAGVAAGAATVASQLTPTARLRNQAGYHKLMAKHHTGNIAKASRKLDQAISTGKAYKGIGILKGRDKSVVKARQHGGQAFGAMRKLVKMRRKRG